MAKSILNPKVPKEGGESVTDEAKKAPTEDETRAVVADVSEDLTRLMEGVSASLDASIEFSLGHQLGDLFEQVDRAFLSPGFGGLLEVPGDVSQEIVDVWVDKLQQLADQGQLGAHPVPKTFLCRMLADGSLFLKRVNLPRGVVLSRDESLESLIVPATVMPTAPVRELVREPVRAPIAADPVAADAPEQTETVPAKPRAPKTLTLGPGGALQVKKEE